MFLKKILNLFVDRVEIDDPIKPIFFSALGSNYTQVVENFQLNQIERLALGLKIGNGNKRECTLYYNYTKFRIQMQLKRIVVHGISCRCLCLSTIGITIQCCILLLFYSKKMGVDSPFTMSYPQMYLFNFLGVVRHRSSCVQYDNTYKLRLLLYIELKVFSFKFFCKLVQKN